MASKNKRLSSAADIFQQSIEGSIRKIPLSEIKPSLDQPRKDTDINLDSLVKSLQAEGLLQPIVVTKSSGDYTIIAGERRFRAATAAGWKEIECRILNKDEKDTFRLAVIENLQREDLNAMEEAEAYHKLKKEFQYTDSEMSKIIGKSRNYISEILSIAGISPKLKQAASKTKIKTKNLLVQLAQAEKSGVALQFISDFEKGNFSTVKEAKQFNQDAKARGKATPKKVKPQASTSAIAIASIDQQKDSLIIQIQLDESSQFTDGNSFRGKLKKLLSEYIKPLI